jgi:hypothetical protein
MTDPIQTVRVLPNTVAHVACMRQAQLLGSHVLQKNKEHTPTKCWPQSECFRSGKEGGDVWKGFLPRVHLQLSLTGRNVWIYEDFALTQEPLLPSVGAQTHLTCSLPSIHCGKSFVVLGLQYDQRFLKAILEWSTHLAPPLMKGAGS